MPHDPNPFVEAKILVPPDRVAEFYAWVARWLAGEALLPAARRGARRSRRASGPAASSYAPIGAHLDALAADEATLTFAEVERIVDRTLPTSARTHRAWWANTDAHSQARTWLAVGWRVDAVDLEAGTVRYVRD